MAKKMTKKRSSGSLLRAHASLGKAMTELKKVLASLAPGAKRRKLRSKINKIVDVRVGLTRRHPGKRPPKESSRKAARKTSRKKTSRRASRKSSRRKASRRKTSRR
jgi:hypothetical protein